MRSVGLYSPRAVEVADALCWDAPEHGHITTFADAAAIAAELYEFAICAQLCDEA